MAPLFIAMQLFTAIMMAAPSFVEAAEIIIKPGRFDRFAISAPEKIVAGQEAVIRLRAVDSFNNVIRDFNKIEREFTLSVSGSAVATPHVFRASNFTDGIFIFSITNKVAETVTILVREKGVPIPVLSHNLQIVPDRPHSFSVEAPSTVRAGEIFNIRITAKDAFSNTIVEPIYGKNLNFIFKGDTEPRVDMPLIPDFKNGIGIVTLVAQKAGTAVVEVKDLIVGISGISNEVKVISGPVHSFAVFTPKEEVIVGEPFEVSIVALDGFGNVVSHYASTGNGVTITSTGRLKPFPLTLPAYAFINGQALVNVRYNAAERISLIITEIGRHQRGESEAVHVIAPIVSRYEIITPEAAVAGQRFKIKITAYNQRGRVFKNYNVFGPDVHLSTTGTGSLVPNRVPASEFTNGTAVVEVQYDRSEAFTIMASPIKPPIKPEVRPIIKKPDPEPVKAPAPQKDPRRAKKLADKEKAKAEIDKKNDAKFLEITNISIAEPRARSTVSIHIPNLDEAIKYNAFTETADGKNWIVLRIRPVTSKIEQPIRFDSSFVGKVIVEEDPKEKETVFIKIEQLKPSRFHVTRERNSLAITLRH
jgi:hypothetical protein